MYKPGFFQHLLKRVYSFYFVYALMLPVLFGTQVKAQGDLMLVPRRVVFEGSKRSMDLNLSNFGKDTARYVISLVDIRMKESGAFETITVPDSGQSFASGFLRFFPRSVTLAPKESQTVKIQITRPKELGPGEYRSHMYFRSVPKEKPLGEKPAVKDSTISIRMMPVFGITIPVIIRVGESTSKANLSDLALEMIRDTVPVLKLRFNRTGNMSVYGDVAVDFISPEGKATRAGIVKGLAVYTPNISRLYTMQLDKTSGINYHEGKLHVVYSEQSGSVPLVLAEAELLLY